MDRIRHSTLVVVVLLLLATFADSHEQCTTPRRVQGQCIEITQCPTLYALLRSPVRSAEDVRFLRDSQCGLIGQIPKVCCDDELPCTTPSGESGVCKEFTSCPSLLSVIWSFAGSLPEIVKKYMRDSACQGAGQYSVCCGRRAPFFRTPAPPVELDVILDAERCGVLPSGERIFGGTEVAIDQFPWLALVEYRTPRRQIKLLCGAVLIGPKYLLTAGHCVKGVVLDKGVPVSVRLGEHDINNVGPDCQVPAGGGLDCNDGAESIPIEEIITHPDYNPYSKLNRNDIALVRLQMEAPYTDFIRHICLPTVDVSQNLQSNNLNLSVAGWGSTETKSSGSNIKLYVELPFKTLKDCQAVYKNTIHLWYKQLCAGGVTGKDACVGDSGGPLMHYNVKHLYEVIGIVSFGPMSCGQPGVPGIYSKVAQYMDWIRSVVRP